MSDILGESMDKVQKSLARVEGQVRGVAKMYGKKESCLKIIQQIAAARAALGKIGRDMLRKEATKCMKDEKEKQRFDKILKQLFKS